MCPICWHWKPVAEQQQFANQNILNIFERKKNGNTKGINLVFVLVQTYITYT